MCVDQFFVHSWNAIYGVSSLQRTPNDWAVWAFFMTNVSSFFCFNALELLTERTTKRANKRKEESHHSNQSLFYMCTLAPMGLWESLSAGLSLRSVHRERFFDFGKWIVMVTKRNLSSLQILFFFSLSNGFFACLFSQASSNLLSGSVGLPHGIARLRFMWTLFGPPSNVRCVDVQKFLGFVSHG